MLFRILLSIIFSVMTYTAHAATEDDRQAMNAAYREYQEIMAKGVAFRTDAIAPAAKAYELSKQVNGDNPTTAALAINYGNVLQNRGEAATVLEDALRITESLHGRNSIELIDPLMALGGVSTDLRDLDKARNYFSRALDVAQDNEAENSMLKGIITLNLGVTNYNNNRPREAINQFRAARDILAMHEGVVASSRLATANLWIGTHQVATGNHANAIEPLLSSLATFISMPETQFFALSNLKLLVEAYEAQGMREEATPHVLAVGAQTMTETVLLYEVPPVLSRVRTPGVAEVSFTVDAEGYPRDAVVVGTPADARFGETALATIEKFRYAPRVVDGEPVATEDVKHTFMFRPSR